MKRFLLGILFFQVPFLCVAQEVLPCLMESVDTPTELREFGVGKGETILESTIGAVSNALGKMKKRLKTYSPSVQFTYETKAVSAEEGEQVEVETTFGQPNIICNEVQMPSHESYIVYVALSVAIPDSLQDDLNNRSNQ